MLSAQKCDIWLLRLGVHDKQVSIESRQAGLCTQNTNSVKQWYKQKKEPSAYRYETCWNIVSLQRKVHLFGK